MKISLRILVVIFTLMLSACVTNGGNVAATKPGAKLDRAKFVSYTIVATARHARNGSCEYGGPLQLIEFNEIPEGKSYGGNLSIGFVDVFREMKCKWTAGDGTPREESVRMDQLLLPRYVEWEHFDGEELVEYEPLQMGGVTFMIEINNRNLSISRNYTVQLYGETLSETSRRIKSIEVNQLLYESK